MNPVARYGSTATLDRRNIRRMTQPALDREAAFSALEMLCRRICLLRVRGRSVEANQLQSSELSRTVTELRTRFGPDSLSEEQVRTIFSRERERVADAAVLAELLGAFMPPPTSVVAAAADLAERTTAFAASAPVPPRQPPAERESPDSSSAPPPPAQAPAIADLLDEMLSQDSQRARRPRGS